jgi:hypothetical protein
MRGDIIPPMPAPQPKAAVNRQIVADGLRGMIRGIGMILWTLAGIVTNFLLYLLAH